MADVRAVREIDAPADRVWPVLVDWPSHGRWMPLTTVRVLTDRPDGVGARFVGRTGIGPLAFDDPMEVVEWQPPAADGAGRCAVVKQGRVVLGRAAFEVVSLADAGRSRVTWTGQVELAPAGLTRPLAPLVAFGGRLLYGRALRRMARELERTG